MKKKSEVRNQKSEIEEAMRAAGYSAITFVPVSVCVQGQQVLRWDVICDPAGILDPESNNYAALRVAEELGISYDELQEYGGAVILRRAVIES